MVGKPKPLPRLLTACVAVAAVCAAAASVSAASPFGAGAEPAEAEAAEPAPGPKGPSDEDRQTYRKIESAYTSGDYDTVIRLAKDFVRSAESEALKTEAARLVAQSQRKKKEWDLAQGAYLSLRNRFEKGSDAFIRAEAVADILRASREGVYLPLVEAGGGEKPKTLDHDPVLDQALACLAKTRARRLELRLPRINRARTVEEVVQRFLPMAEEIRQLRAIWPEMPPNLERAAVQKAAMRLAPLSRKTIALLKEKDAYYAAVAKKRGLNSSRRSEMLQYKAMCKNLAAAEKAFLQAMDQLPGTRDWPEGQTLRQESDKRRAEYDELALAFTPPARRDRGNRGTDWRDGGRTGPRR
jgi:hypothetical protein